MLVSLLSYLMHTIELGLLGQVFVPITSLWITLMFSCALYRLQVRENFQALLDFKLLVKMSVALWRPLALPLLGFYGFFVLVRPLYGLSFFLGFLLILSYTVICLRTMETRKQRVL
jgi:hypothetical protein